MADSTLIIAEAGVNHNGDLALAKGLIDAAAKAGADLVKFQTLNRPSATASSARAPARPRTSPSPASPWSPPSPSALASRSPPRTSPPSALVPASHPCAGTRSSADWRHVTIRPTN